MSEFDKNISERFAERLCDLMQENRTDVEQIANDLHLNPSALYKWARKVSVPNFENALSIADYFHCSLDYLFGLKDIEAQYAPHAPAQSFDKHFSAVLAEKKVTEYRLVKQTGISRSKIAAWRKGTSLPSLHSLILVATALDISLDSLVGRI